MPRNTDPKDIDVGSGRAGQDSVTGSSLTVNLNTTVNTGGGGGGPVEAKDVSSEPPDRLSGENVQDNLHGINALGPERLNYLGESSAHDLNASELSYTPDLVEGLYYDPDTATNKNAYLVNSDNITVTGLLFPADRGILAVKLDGTVIQALNLGEIFAEGYPDETVAPSRVIGQLDYVAGSHQNASVDGLVQGISLTDRLPQLTEYTRANFPFLSGGPDPVYEGYGDSYTPYQLARAQIDIDIGATVGAKGELRLVHYKTRTDYEADKLGLDYRSFADLSLSGGYDLFYDSAIDAIDLGISSWSMNDTVNTGAATPRWLSGVLYYAPDDTFTLSWTATNMYADSFLEEGAELEWHDTISDHQHYTEYSPNGTESLDLAEFSDLGRNLAGTKVSISQPVLRAKDPFGNDASEAYSGSTLLLHTSDYGSMPPSRLTLETFNDETVRWDANTEASDLMAVDGTGTTFDSTAALPSNELQLRGANSSDVHGLVDGGVLAVPSGDYSIGHLPSSNTADYTALPVGDRRYIRSFDVGGPKRKGRFRFVAKAYNLTSFDNNFLYQLGANYEGHPDGLKIEVAPAGVPGQEWLDLGRHYLEGPGAMVDIENNSSNDVVVTYQLDNFPQEDTWGFHAVAIRITVYGGSPIYSNDALGLYRVEWLPAQ